jgi:hypothetical protein
MPSLDQSKSKLELRSSFNDTRDDFLNPSFHPEINQRSKKMKRSGSVGEILYEDAKLREEKMHEIRTKAEASKIPEIKKKWSLEKSEKVLGRKLSRELQDAILSAQSSLSKQIDKIDLIMF